MLIFRYENAPFYDLGISRFSRLSCKSTARYANKAFPYLASIPGDRLSSMQRFALTVFKTVGGAAIHEMHT